MREPSQTSADTLVIVGRYAPADQPGLHSFRFNETTGTLTACGSYAGITNPSFFAIHPNQRWLYAVSETSEQDGGTTGTVWACHLERESGAIQLNNQQRSGGDSPCHVLLDEAGHWLLVANYGNGSIAVLPILPDGSLGEMTDVVQHHGKGAHPQRQTGPHAHSTMFTLDKRFVIAADLGLDQLVIYTFDAAVGKLGEHARTNTRAGAGPRHMAFHPNGRQLYVANELDSTLDVYAYEPLSGTLQAQQTIATIPAGIGENAVSHIQISSSGQQVYVANRGHNSIAVFAVAGDEQVELSTTVSCGGDWPRHFALTPGGRWLLVANQYSGDVAVLPLPTGSAAIGTTTAQVAMAQASCIQCT